MPIIEQLLKIVMVTAATITAGTMDIAADIPMVILMDLVDGKKVE
jgi:hypothetical protein